MPLSLRQCADNNRWLLALSTERLHICTHPQSLLQCLLFCMRKSPNQFLEATMQNWWFDGCCPYLVFQTLLPQLHGKFSAKQVSSCAGQNCDLDVWSQESTHYRVSLEKQTNPRGSFPSNKQDRIIEMDYTTLDIQYPIYQSWILVIYGLSSFPSSKDSNAKTAHPVESPQALSWVLHVHISSVEESNR